ncbi:DUF6884 domain-containing protein [Kitasatospora sp. NPDC059327]|uniref:DUF6884 domain-containing protein n=1 Tax=Kitasatospora sp. NPDC059327 TaxID=3346803 RepID=UPI00369CC3E9
MASSPGAPALVVVGCSARKSRSLRPVAALDLYQGWCVPPLRARLAERGDLRRRTLILSARHGLLKAEDPVLPYDQPLTPERAAALQSAVRAQLAEHLQAFPASEALLLLEPAYLALLGHPPVPMVHTVTDPVRHWAAVDSVLDAWGW